VKSPVLFRKQTQTYAAPRILDAGLLAFEEALALQRKIVAEVISGWGNETLIVCEHPPVVTYGRRTRMENILVGPQVLLAAGIGLYAVDRGGDVTYHGPGQLVLYPILDLRRRGRDVHFYLRQLELCVINALREHYGLNAYRKQGLTGVWVGPYKVASIGVGVKNWVTYHGVALNVANDMAPFEMIRACGGNGQMAAIASFFKDEDLPIQEVKGCLIESFRKVFFQDGGGPAR